MYERPGTKPTTVALVPVTAFAVRAGVQVEPPFVLCSTE